MSNFGLDDQGVVLALEKGSYLSQQDLETARVGAKQRGINLLDFLLENKLVTEDLIGQAVAETYNLPFYDLKAHPAISQNLKLIPEEVARRHRLVVANINDQEAVIVTDQPHPDQDQNLQDLFSNRKIIFNYGLPELIDHSLELYRKSLEARFVDIIKKEQKVAPEIIGEIIKDAVFFRASDVHFEPQENEVVVRFRIDGALQEAGRIAKVHYDNILNRIKVQARMRIDEHYSAQDGAIRFNEDGVISNIRISIVPILDGEKVVARILSEYVKELSLPDLGLSDEDRKVVEAASQKPHGMILSVGPTGSGKTTTLYALVKILNRPDANITTIEDPVEYKILGVSQINVNNKTNLSFAEGLKSIVRQDPDVILVGEIRDKETAEISVNAALTGHLLLSTFHANDAISAMPRLIEMGVEPFLLASTLELIIAQRLVRRICQNCRYSVTLNRSQLQPYLKSPEAHFSHEEITLYRGKGCQYCNGTGFRGRVAIFEILQVNSGIKDLVLKNPSSREIYELARQNGFKQMFYDGLSKVISGLTTFEELIRVAREDED